jgi:hypothetical protein
MRPDRGYLLMYRQFPFEGGKGEDVEVDRGKGATEDGDDFVRGGSHEAVQVQVRVQVESVGVHRFFSGEFRERFEMTTDLAMITLMMLKKNRR